MTGQGLQAAMVGNFGMETHNRGKDVGMVWMATLEEANAGIKRSAWKWIAERAAT